MKKGKKFKAFGLFSLLSLILIVGCEGVFDGANDVKKKDDHTDLDEMKVSFNYRGDYVTYGIIKRGGLYWMDRNLGAQQLPNNQLDPEGYGDLFQWGREDDGHQVRSTEARADALSNSDKVDHVNFILAPDDPGDWRSPQNNNLWQGENGINSPCPEGWRLPTSGELNTERLSWPSNDADGAWASTLKWTTTGFRNREDGEIYHAGSYGLYWSSTASGIGSNRLLFSRTATEANVGMTYRAHGFAVRCVMEDHGGPGAHPLNGMWRVTNTGEDMEDWTETWEIEISGNNGIWKADDWPDGIDIIKATHTGNAFSFEVHFEDELHVKGTFGNNNNSISGTVEWIYADDEIEDEEEDITYFSGVRI